MARISEGLSFERPHPAASLLEALCLIGRAFRGSLSILAVLLFWEAFARSGWVSSFLLPSFSSVVERMAGDTLSGALFANLGPTLYRTFLGFLVAGCAGVGLGILMARNAVVRWFFDPVVSVAFPMPKIAFLPIFMLWFGLYDFSKISMVVFNAIFPVITAAMAATEGVEKELLWSAESLGASRRRLLWEIVLPAALPQIMTGLQVALPVAMIVTVVTEMLMGGPGLGGAMIAASRFADSPGVFADILEIAIAGFLLVKGMALLRRRLLAWHQEAKEPTTV